MVSKFRSIQSGLNLSTYLSIIIHQSFYPVSLSLFHALSLSLSIFLSLVHVQHFHVLFLWRTFKSSYATALCSYIFMSQCAVWEWSSVLEIKNQNVFFSKNLSSITMVLKIIDSKIYFRTITAREIVVRSTTSWGRGEVSSVNSAQLGVSNRC